MEKSKRERERVERLGEELAKEGERHAGGAEQPRVR